MCGGWKSPNRRRIKTCIANEFCSLPLFNYYGENEIVTEYKDKDHSVAKCEGKDQ